MTIEVYSSYLSHLKTVRICLGVLLMSRSSLSRGSSVNVLRPLPTPCLAFRTFFCFSRVVFNKDKHKYTDCSILSSGATSKKQEIKVNNLLLSKVKKL